MANYGEPNFQHIWDKIVEMLNGEVEPININVDEVRSTANTALNSASSAQQAASDAQQAANEAQQSADAAQQDADDAKTAAQTAWDYADTANTAASAAQSSANAASTAAGNAQASANTANASANNALTMLSVVESVVDTLNWITEHGTYALTTDTAIDPNKTYFVNTGTAQDPVYEPVAEPRVEDISTYYELTIDKALSDFVSSHLALTNDGLYVFSDANSYKVLIANTGMKIFDENGEVVATYEANSTKIGKEDDCYAEVTKNGFRLVDYTNVEFFEVEDLRSGSTTAEVTHNYTITSGVDGWYLNTLYKIDSIVSATINGTEVGATISSEKVAKLNVQATAGDTVKLTYIAIAPYATITDTYTGDGSNRYFNLSIPAKDTSYTVKVNGVDVTPSSKWVDSFTITPAPSDGDLISATYQTISSYAKKLDFGRRSGNPGAMSVIIGQLNEATKAFSTAIGYGLKTPRSDSTAVGRYNSPFGNNLFEVGIGNNGSERKTGFAVNMFGDTKVKRNIYVGCDDDSKFGDRLDLDYIVEQGTKNGTASGAFSATVTWKYRIWKSGLREAWCVAGGSCNATISNGGGFSTDNLAVSIPSGIFTSAPMVQCSIYNAANTSGILAAVGCTAPSATSTGEWAGFRYSQRPQNEYHYFNFYCVQ